MLLSNPLLILSLRFFGDMDSTLLGVNNRLYYAYNEVRCTF